MGDNREMLTCIIDDCSAERIRRGFCNKHYRRYLKYGDADKTSYERATNGEPLKFLENSLLLETDDCIIWPYGKDGDGYGFMNGKAVHREICFRVHGEPVSDANQAAHYCGNCSCVNKRHLRWATRSENMLDKHDHLTMVTRGNKK